MHHLVKKKAHHATRKQARYGYEMFSIMPEFKNNPFFSKQKCIEKAGKLVFTEPKTSLLCIVDFL